MSVLTLYAVTAVVVGLGLVALSDFYRGPLSAGECTPLLCAAVAGALWPVLVVGAAQVGLVAMLGRSLASGPRREAQLPVA